MRYVNAEKLESIFNPCMSGKNEYKASTVLITIQSLETEDVKPVIHSNWQGVSPFVDTIECCNCGWQEISYELATRYCPDCGAKMDNYKEMIEIGLSYIEFIGDENEV